MPRVGFAALQGRADGLAVGGFSLSVGMAVALAVETRSSARNSLVRAELVEGALERATPRRRTGVGRD